MPSINGALAALALRILLPDLSEQAIKDGLYHMFWAGRMEEVESARKEQEKISGKAAEQENKITQRMFRVV